MTRQRILKRVRCISNFVTIILTIAMSSLWAAPSYYEIKDQRLLLPTGCKLGFGPQYQSFDGFMGQILMRDGQQVVDFDPILICKAAAKICLSQLPGPSCCLNACKQSNTDLDTKSNLAMKTDEAGYRRCAEKCVGTPTYETESIQNKTQLESQIELRFRAKK